MPDGRFSYQKYQFGYILESLGMVNVGEFYGHLEYFTHFWYVSWSFGIFFPVLVCCINEKSGNLDVSNKSNNQQFQQKCGRNSTFSTLSTFHRYLTNGWIILKNGQYTL
jgi:hypothetical protein